MRMNVQTLIHFTLLTDVTRSCRMPPCWILTACLSMDNTCDGHGQAAQPIAHTVCSFTPRQQQVYDSCAESCLGVRKLHSNPCVSYGTYSRATWRATKADIKTADLIRPAAGMACRPAVGKICTLCSWIRDAEVHCWKQGQHAQCCEQILTG